MLLVVNPIDPASLQIANAYAALRDIPANNILFIAPPPDYHNDGQPISQAEVTSYYLNPIASAISSRGLTNQINYIGTIGQANCYSITPQSGTPATTANSLNYALELLTPLTNGSGLTLQGATYQYSVGPTSALYQDPTNIPVGSNPAILHLASYNVAYPTAGSSFATNYYMSGCIGYTGTNGNTPGQVIASLASATAADGTHSGGIVYYEDRVSDSRSTMRVQEWLTTYSQLAARNVSYQFEANTSGATPLNRSTVRGAICGSATLALTNGSTYLPGSWADDVTSFGCEFPDTTQTKATRFIAAGAAGTTGAVAEPYTIATRFTNTSIYTFIADGSTLGEAIAKSVASPDVQMPLGDMLAQPSADVPKAAITAGPGNYGGVQGTISIAASAGLTSPRIATGIGALELLVDGMVSSGSLAGGVGTFSLNTTGMSDGVHELRVVAVNNAQAASEGYAAMPIVVNNYGRSVNFNGGNLTLTASASAIGLATSAGGGTISQVELTCLGRIVAQASGPAGSLSLSPTALAPGDNVIVPLAVFTDGSQVAGGAFTVHLATGAINGWTNGAGTGLWSNPANWSGGTLPQNGDGVARFSGGAGGGTATLDASASVEELDLANSGGNYTIAASPGQTLTLSSSNGPMSECLINVSSGNHLISAPLQLSTAGVIMAIGGSGDSLTISSTVGGSGGLTKSGCGTLILTGSDNYRGGTIVAGGTLEVGNGGSGASLIGTASIVDNASLIFNHADRIILGASISGNGSVTVKGTGTLTLTGTDSYAGGTFVNSGKLILQSNSSLPSGSALVVGDGTKFIRTGASAGATGSTAVPEPSVLSLLAGAAACLPFFARRRSHSRAAGRGGVLRDVP